MQSDHKWTKPPEKSQINPEEVHIWRGFIPVELDQQMTGTLSAEEQQRAARFVRQKDRHGYSFAHGMLRAVLAYYLSVDPQSIVFNNNPYGKPSLCQSVGEADICFNMAHSEEMVAVAVTWRTPVGVDIEFMREIRDADQIIARNFSVEEQRYLTDSSARPFMDRFFTCWALKEAFIKAIGMGLSYPLQAFNIIDSRTGTPGSGWVTLQDSTEVKWYQYPFQPHPLYRAAIVVADIKPLPLFYDFNIYIESTGMTSNWVR